jgi:hypothetical protein
VHSDQEEAALKVNVQLEMRDAGGAEGLCRSVLLDEATRLAAYP